MESSFRFTHAHHSYRDDAFFPSALLPNKSFSIVIPWVLCMVYAYLHFTTFQLKLRQIDKKTYTIFDENKILFCRVSGSLCAMSVYCSLHRHIFWRFLLVGACYCICFWMLVDVLKTPVVRSFFILSSHFFAFQVFFPIAAFFTFSIFLLSYLQWKTISYIQILPRKINGKMQK